MNYNGNPPIKQSDYLEMCFSERVNFRLSIYPHTNNYQEIEQRIRHIKVIVKKEEISQKYEEFIYKLSIRIYDAITNYKDRYFLKYMKKQREASTLFQDLGLPTELYYIILNEMSKIKKKHILVNIKNKLYEAINNWPVSIEYMINKYLNDINNLPIRLSRENRKTIFCLAEADSDYPFINNIGVSISFELIKDIILV